MRASTLTPCDALPVESAGWADDSRGGVSYTPWAVPPTAAAIFGAIFTESEIPSLELRDNAELTKETSTPPKASLASCQDLRAEASVKMLIPASKPSIVMSKLALEPSP